MDYFLAVDIGASSGRHILGSVQNGALVLEEIYRFENKLVKKIGKGLFWDVDYLYSQIIAGLAECKKKNRIPKTVAIDTWAVDYVLLDGDKAPILPAYSYRDDGTRDAVRAVEDIILQSELYKKTGIQFQPFNTIYQLYRDKLSGRLLKARHFLMIPEYFSYLLTGVMKNEYTNATSTGLVNAFTKSFDKKLLIALGIDDNLFLPLSYPCEEVGRFTPKVQSLVGFDATVVLCASHDTASAVAACGVSENEAYISSGTWSLIGICSKDPIISKAAQQANFTNEGAHDGDVCFLKNCAGTWLLQGLRRDLSLDCEQLMEMAQNAKDYCYIDVNSPKLTAPESMLCAIKELSGNPNLKPDAAAATVYHSLARAYFAAIDEIENITGKNIKKIRIVGGGSRDNYLNRLTAEYTKKTVVTGPAEATAAGNILSQLKICEGDKR